MKFVRAEEGEGEIKKEKQKKMGKSKGTGIGWGEWVWVVFYKKHSYYFFWSILKKPNERKNIFFFELNPKTIL